MSMNPGPNPDPSAQRPEPGAGAADAPAPRWLLALELSYVVALVLLAVLYGQLLSLRQLAPSQVGPIPIGVPWWGALGGVTISLTGIFRHRRDWDESLNNWHIARPILGAIMGSVGYLIFATVIRSTGTSVNNHSGNARAVFFLVAFLLGYREEVFREVLRKAVDVLLAPGGR